MRVVAELLLDEAIVLVLVTFADLELGGAFGSRFSIHFE